MIVTAISPPSHTPRYRLWFWVAGAALFFVFIFLVRGILLPFVVGIMAAYFLDPAVRKLHARGLSRTASAGIITIGFFLSLILLGVALAPAISRQLTELARDLPEYFSAMEQHYSAQLQAYMEQLESHQASTIKSAVGDFSSTLMAWIGRAAGGVLQSGLALLNILSLIFIMPIVAFYLLRDWDRLTQHVDALLPRDHIETLHAQLRLIDATLSGFIRGQTNVCLVMAAYLGVALSLVGLHFGLLIGILTGFFLFLPFVGIASGFTLSLIVGVFQFGWSIKLLGVAVIFALGMAAENSFLTPRLVGDKVGLHPLWIIFGMLAGGALFGFVGVLLSVPVTAVLGVLVRFAAARYLQSSLYLGVQTPAPLLLS